MQPVTAQQLLARADRRRSLLASGLVERLAVLATFDPAWLSADPDVDDVVDLLCEEQARADGSPRYTLGEGARVEALARALRRGGLEELRSTRQGLPLVDDSALQRVLDLTIFGEPLEVAQRSEDELLALLTVIQWFVTAFSEADLHGHAGGLRDSKDEIESRLALLEITRAVRLLDQAGCVGRGEELRILDEYRRQAPDGTSLSEDPAMVVYGVGGVGKSTVMARFVMDLVRESEGGYPVAWAYLDMDRPSLRTYEPASILDDIIFQAGAHFSGQRRGFEGTRVLAAEKSLGVGLEGVSSELSYEEAAFDFAVSFRGITDGPLVVILDTFEEVARAAPDQRELLYRLFSLLRSEIPRLKLIVSGRAPAQVFVDADRTDRILEVGAVTGEPALELLTFLVHQAAGEIGVDPPGIAVPVAEEIVRTVGGNPLTLKLASRVLVGEGLAAIRGAADLAHTLDRVRAEVVRGFLYQRILEHVVGPDPKLSEELRDVARASVVLRRLDATVLDMVVLPNLKGRPTYPGGWFLDALRSEVAFYVDEGPTLWLRQELRGPALLALRYEDDAYVERLHRAAVEFYSGNPEEESQVEYAYHRLSLGDPPEMLDLTPEIVRLLEVSLEDMPEAIRNALLGGQWDNDALRELRRWERSVESQADGAIRAGRLEVARNLLAERPDRTPDSPLHALESRLLEAFGDLEGATRAASREMDAAVAAANAGRYAAAAIRVAGLEETAARPEAAAAVLRRAGANQLLAGRWEVRLELVLNLMVSLERNGLLTDDERWPLDLDARRFLTRCDPGMVDGNTALLRLLAASLGRDEPDRLRTALDRLGLGFEEDPVLIRRLASALAAWDRAQPEPGSLAAAAGIRSSVDDLEDAWLSGLSGLGVEAGQRLAKLWHVQAPPEDVREAMRGFYLWWGIGAPSLREPLVPPVGNSPDRSPTDLTRSESRPPAPTRSGRSLFDRWRNPFKRIGARPAGEAAVSPPGNFLDQSPPDFTLPEMREFERIVAATYGDPEELVYLASSVGLRNVVEPNTSQRLAVRQVITESGQRGRLRELAEFMVTDTRASPFHARLEQMLRGDQGDDHQTHLLK